MTLYTDLHNGIIDMNVAYGKSFPNNLASHKCFPYLQIVADLGELHGELQLK